MNDDFAPCWNCGKLNKKQLCGYYMCDCKNYKESNVLWYLPIKTQIQKEINKKQDELFLDDEETKWK